jgi:hypothetical protein
MPVIFRKQGYLTVDPDTWTTGAGSSSGYGQNGNTGENQRVTDTDPWGGQSVVWETRASGDGGADGGWNADSISIDRTKLYRFSVWVRRTSSTGGGTFYFGTAGGSECPNQLGTTNQMCNPYWNCSSPSSLTQNQWYLVVAHIFPYTYTSTDAHPDTGFWVTGQPTGSKVMSVNQCNIGGGDLKWGASSDSTYHRTYHFYCGDSTTRLQFFRPRIDICDGSQPTVQALLENKQNALKSYSVFNEGGSFTHQRVNANGGVITEVGEWRIHRFNSTANFTLFGYKGDKLEVDYLIVAGGGGGGMDMGGGGGGGGVLNSSTVIGPGTYTITVGGGGTGAPAGSTNGQPAYHQFTIGATQGGNSSALGYTATGGGYGASSYYGYTPNYGTPGNGGSGGGPSGYSDGSYRTGGTGISGQGRSGGNGGPQYYSGGGGGADLPGNGTNSAVRPDAGDGRLVTILGRPFYWGGGGGGASYSLSTGGYGGKGGGGGGALGTTYGGGNAIAVGSPGGGGSPGTWAQTPGGNGATNTGGGGGGGSHYNSNNKGGDGGSGIVIIRYKFK